MSPEKLDRILTTVAIVVAIIGFGSFNPAEHWMLRAVLAISFATVVGWIVSHGLKTMRRRQLRE